MVDVIGILSGIITIASFFQDLAPDPDRYKHRIRVGQRSGDSGGWFPQAIFRDYYGNVLARSSWQSNWVENGEFKEESFGDDRRQVDEIEILAANNAVCFVWHELYDSDGSDPIVMFGETLKWCGAPWYPSDIRANIGGYDDYRDCAWLNACYNDPEGNCRDSAWSGYNLNDLRYWNNVKSGSADPYQACNNIWAYHPSRKRSVAPNIQLAGDIIYTSRPIATTVCQSDTSVGQSLVSTSQKLFCDMFEKQMYPLCQDGMIDTCFDVATNQMRPAAGARMSTTRTFRSSEVRLDDDSSSSIVKRNDALENLEVNGSLYYYSNTSQCEDCCLSVTNPDRQFNETHYFGPIVAQPVTYDRIANGIIINSSSDNSSIILDCPAGYSTHNVFRGVNNVSNDGPRIAVATVLASILATVIALAVMHNQD